MTRVTYYILPFAYTMVTALSSKFHSTWFLFNGCMHENGPRHLQGHNPMSSQICSGASLAKSLSKIVFPSVLTNALQSSFWPVSCSQSWKKI